VLGEVDSFQGVILIFPQWVNPVAGAFWHHVVGTEELAEVNYQYSDQTRDTSYSRSVIPLFSRCTVGEMLLIVSFSTMFFSLRTAGSPSLFSTKE
jgi:hypothetical protein